MSLSNTQTTTIIASTSRADIEHRRQERAGELERLAQRIADARRGEARDYLVADLLALLGVIHNTPVGKADWVYSQGD